MTRRRTGAGRRDEKGFVIVWMSLLMLGLMSFAGLGLDFATWYIRSNELQRAADAAALAGVVWMPSHWQQAKQAAEDTLRKNGVDPLTEAVVSKVPSSDKRLQVSVIDPDVPAYFSAVFMKPLTVRRTAVAEYINPIPLGSPYNIFGFGAANILPASTSVAPQYFWGAVNGYCTDKQDGDLYLSRYFQSGTTCTGTESFDYSDDGYYVTLDVPANTEIWLYDAAFNPWQSSTELLHPGASSALPARTSPDVPRAANAAIDTRFSMTFDQNETPREYGDDVPVQGSWSGWELDEAGVKEYPSGGSAETTARWSFLAQLPVAGRYRLQVQTPTNGTGGLSLGANAFSVFARPTGNAWTVCQDLGDPLLPSACPRVSGESSMSIYANSPNTTSRFHLAYIDPANAGKQMVISIWDPGEGGDYISIRNPDGNIEPINVNEEGVRRGRKETQLSVRGSRFDGKKVDISIDIPSTYADDYSTYWWSIEYGMESGRPVTDRTTWVVQVLGDPLRLVRPDDLEQQDDYQKGRPDEGGGGGGPSEPGQVY